MKTQNYLQVAVFGLFLVFQYACTKETSNLPDTLPPAEVSNLESIAGNGKITLNWTDPTDADFQKIEITYLSNTVEVNKGIQTKEITGLTNGTSYSFTVKTIDETGNKSSGLQTSNTPIIPPALTWSNNSTSILNPNNGIVTISRTFTNNGGAGTIDFNSKVTLLSNNSITSNISKSFSIQPSVQYRITLTCNGSATKNNCTACSSQDKFKIEIVSLIDNMITSINIGISCSSLYNCGYMWGQDKTEWNSIAVTNMIIEQEE